MKVRYTWSLKLEWWAQCIYTCRDYWLSNMIWRWWRYVIKKKANRGGYLLAWSVILGQDDWEKLIKWNAENQVYKEDARAHWNCQDCLLRKLVDLKDSSKVVKCCPVRERNYDNPAEWLAAVAREWIEVYFPQSSRSKQAILELLDVKIFSEKLM